MNLNTRKKVFLIIWIIILLLGPITVLVNTSYESLTNPLVLTNFFQRLTGLTAYTLLGIQIILGSNMDRFVQVVGARAYKLHITQGLITYGFVLFHPLLENLLVYQITRSLVSAIQVFIPSFTTQRDIFLVFGRTAFILLTIAVFASYFRTKTFFRRNWRAFHILNYLVFYLVFIHARVGSDVKSFPFVLVYWLLIIIVSFSVILRLLKYFRFSQVSSKNAQ